MEYYVFTFGLGTKFANKYVKVYGDYGTARQKMINRFGLNWAFQYSAEQWTDWEDTRPSWITETLLCEIK